MHPTNSAQEIQRIKSPGGLRKFRYLKKVIIITRQQIAVKGPTIIKYIASIKCKLILFKQISISYYFFNYI